jgi:hypothetical protein
MGTVPAWIGGLVAVGVVIAVVIGLLANSQSVAETRYCNNLSSLESALTSLTSSASQGDFQSGVSAVQSAWGDVQSSAQHLSGINMSSIDSAWDSFAQAVQGVPDSASVSDATQSISESANGLESAVKSSFDSYDCSDSSSS